MGDDHYQEVTQWWLKESEFESAESTFNGYNLSQLGELLDCRIVGEAGTIQLTLRDYETLCMQTLDRDWCTCDTSSFFPGAKSEDMKSKKVEDVSDEKTIIRIEKMMFQIIPVLVIILIIATFVCLMLRKSDR